eukprot:4434109-Prymnesium_polylepis.1
MLLSLAAGGAVHGRRPPQELAGARGFRVAPRHAEPRLQADQQHQCVGTVEQEFALMSVAPRQKVATRRSWRHWVWGALPQWAYGIRYGCASPKPLRPCGVSCARILGALGYALVSSVIVCQPCGMVERVRLRFRTGSVIRGCCERSAWLWVGLSERVLTKWAGLSGCARLVADFFESLSVF